ncbi:hypothetical protein MB901379_04117 [Mycobacterium basiliense]|uniref:Uncharacterized protein n=1 Tax=Mycobacterium basiliense TaxID=2094119 RepID=A0A3S4CYW7_9MYCO|nr:hypothetical protein MB901379_04117 [Mycobacterium basiliense]
MVAAVHGESMRSAERSMLFDARISLVCSVFCIHDTGSPLTYGE